MIPLCAEWVYQEGDTPQQVSEILSQMMAEAAVATDEEEEEHQDEDEEQQTLTVADFSSLIVFLAEWLDKENYTPEQVSDILTLGAC